MARSGTTYTIEIAEEAADFIRARTKKNQRQIMGKIASLASDPRTKGQPLKGSNDLFRIRTGNCRIVYQVHERQIRVAVVVVGHRKDIYKHLKRMRLI